MRIDGGLFEMLIQSFISLCFHSDKIEPYLGLTATTNCSSQLKFRKPTLSPSSGVLLWPHSPSSVDVESYQNPDDGDEIGFWNANVFERPDMDVIPRRFYEIFWAIVETLLSGLIQSQEGL
jgi:hypothetical protein